jgi:hypothetical protein
LIMNYIIVGIESGLPLLHNYILGWRRK